MAGAALAPAGRSAGAPRLDPLDRFRGDAAVSVAVGAHILRRPETRDVNDAMRGKTRNPGTNVPGLLVCVADMGFANYRLENWNFRRAPRWPYFLRSFMRLSRVRKPPLRSACSSV